MKVAAVFLYGTSVGAVLTGVILSLVTDAGEVSLVPWFTGIGAVSLALALLVHQRAIQLSKGRRWRKTKL